ncbi:inner membrane protein [Halogranum rubrum]|uniref:Inner membrane protein n=1 Tax=Halogranum rubrum TaxID=553466 RepID=A0A1I4IZ21_9EURY|nr:metal-dependent hydrolase [Halogranum rubrum]SFL59111.1 inner membrane protein [Halogranum rubrum]
MYLPGHLGIALLCSTPLAAFFQQSGLRRASQVGVLGFLVTASAPDVDLYLSAVPHRGITHTFVAATAVGLLFGVVAASTRLPALQSRRRDFTFGFAVGTLGISTHLAGDVITPMGIQPFAPLLDAHYTLNLVYASDPTANAGFLVAGAAAHMLSTAFVRGRVPSSTPTQPQTQVESTTPLVETEPDLS